MVCLINKLAGQRGFIYSREAKVKYKNKNVYTKWFVVVLINYIKIVKLHHYANLNVIEQPANYGEMHYYFFHMFLNSSNNIKT